MTCQSQAVRWAIQRIKHPAESQSLSEPQTRKAQRAGPPPISSSSGSGSRSQRASPARRMSMSCQRYTADVARRICHSLDGFQYVPSANLSSDGSPVSYRLLDDHQDIGPEVSDENSFAISAAEASRLRRLWRRQLVEDAGRTI